MRTLSLFCLLHFAATVAGWYLLSALAQGVADSAAGPSLALVVFNGIIRLLSFPVLSLMLSFYPLQIGGYSPISFLAFAGLAAINSMVVVGIIAAVGRAIHGRFPHSS
jgi:hypothetical protein